MKPSTPAAIDRIDQAMALVQRAQLDLDRATQLLSSLRYGADLYAECGEHRDAVHTFWRVLKTVQKERNGMSVDSEREE